MRSLQKKLVRDLWHMRSQVLSIALVAACGMATYVTMRGCYESIAAAQKNYYEQYRFADVFAQLKRAPESLAARLAKIPGVAVVETRVVEEVTLDVPGLMEPALGRLISLPVRGEPRLNTLFLREGRWIEAGARHEVLASEAFASANGLRPGDSIGAVINGRWQRLYIAGVALSPEYVYEIRSGDIFPDNRRFGVLWMSREALGPAFQMEGAFNDVSFSLTPGTSEPEVIARIDTLLESYGSLGAHGRDEQLSHRFLSDEISQDRVTGIFVPSIFLGVAVFLVHVVLTRLVSTQRNAIGLLKAFGYGNLSIGLHYLQFAAAALLLGALLGMPLGMWMGRGMARLYADFFRFPELLFAPGGRLFLVALALSGGAAALGALAAVRTAAALPPAEAMRPESPPVFRAGLAELLGIQEFFQIGTRIILRNVQRRPGKAGLNVIGMALAVAILIVGFYFYDAIDYLVKVEFQTALRDDVTLTFSTAQSASAVHDLEHLPGVWRSEPFRTVPARLRFAHRSRRIAILGLQPNGQLRRLVNSRMEIVELPPEGMVLSAKLAQILGVVPGDAVTVEVLEGDRVVQRVTVTATVDELIGMAAYMDIRALHALLRESGTISGAFLAVDPRASPRLYSLLKSTPAVSGVAVREAMLQGFYQTIARSLRITTGALVIFASIIAAGMVYNGARISLSERGQELGSLRVLGFTQREIGWMLLGEQGLLAAVSVPAGFGLGYAICKLLTAVMQTELYRMPLVITGRTYVLAFVVVALASAITGILIFRRMRRMDLIAVLKTRE